MAKGAYIGVGGKARSVRQMYVGVGGKARRVTKAYVGVSGKARLCWQPAAAQLPEKKSLNESSWAEIQAVAAAGKAAEYWSLGDRKAVTLQGNAGSISLAGTYYAYIIGFDHNAALEGSGTLHFQLGYTALSGGRNIAFTDNGYYYKQSSGKYFCINDAQSAAGGWRDSRMRTVILPELKNAMPAELRAVLKPVNKYTNNVGNSNQREDISVTADDIFLLSEFEVKGARAYANSYEQNYQKQYAYYADGTDAKWEKTHHYASSYVHWWTRSPHYNGAGAFCHVSTAWGSVSFSDARYSYGCAPGFCVG